MTTPQPLDGPRVKLDRADEHLCELDASIKRYMETEPLELVPEVDLDEEILRLKVASVRSPMPEDWSVIVGDIVHNLRCALDYVAWQLVLANGGEPGYWTQFPILDREPTSARAQKAWDRTLSGVADADRKALAELQPYHRGDEAHLHPLAALRELSNEDKHRILLPAVTAIAHHDEATLELLGTEDCEVASRYSITVNTPLRVGSIVLTLRLRRTGPRPRVNAVGHLPFNIAFGTGMVDVPSLFTVRDFVRAAIADKFGARLNATLA